MTFAASPKPEGSITFDPAGMAGSGTNLYAYVDDDPVNGTDPSGLGFLGIAIDLTALADAGSELGASEFLSFVGSYSNASFDPPNDTIKPPARQRGALASWTRLDRSYPLVMPCTMRMDG